MQRLEVSCAVRRIYTSLGARGLIKNTVLSTEYLQFVGDLIPSNPVQYRQYYFDANTNLIFGVLTFKHDCTLKLYEWDFTVVLENGTAQQF